MPTEIENTVAQEDSIHDGAAASRAAYPIEAQIDRRRHALVQIIRLLFLGASLTLFTCGCATEQAANKSTDNAQPKTITDFVGKPRPAY